MTTDEKPIEKDLQFGFVLMADALGVSSYTISECKTFFEKQEKLKSEIGKDFEAMSNLTYYKYSTFISFGDTVILCWPINGDETQEIVDIFLEIATQATILMCWGLEHGILFRGSIAIGPYLINNEKNTALGPAIFDANNWYNSADWFGIIITPKSQLLFESAIERAKKIKNKNLSHLKQLVVPYDVPLSRPINDKKSKTLYTIGWPFGDYSKYRAIKKDVGVTYLTAIFAELYKTPFSKEGDSKISNSVDYIKWYDEHIIKKLPK
jgi:hypothetical protein